MLHGLTFAEPAADQTVGVLVAATLAAGVWVAVVGAGTAAPLGGELDPLGIGEL